MAVGVRIDIAGATLEQYDEICRLMGLTPRGTGPAGLLFHWAAKHDGGVLVTDVWRDRERFDEFAHAAGGRHQAAGDDVLQRPQLPHRPG